MELKQLEGLLVIPLRSKLFGDIKQEAFPAFQEMDLGEVAPSFARNPADPPFLLELAHDELHIALGAVKQLGELVQSGLGFSIGLFDLESVEQQQVSFGVEHARRFLLFCSI